MTSLELVESSNNKNLSIEQAKYANTIKYGVSSFDYVDPLENVQTAIKIGYKKAASTSLRSSSCRFGRISRTVMRSIMSGAYVSFTMTLSMHAMSLGEWDKVSALLLFPMGFVMLILMGNDLATGNFALLPMAYLDGKRKDKDKGVSIVDVLINWLIVYSGNGIGALLFLFLYCQEIHIWCT